MKWTFTAIILILLIFTSPLVQSRAEQIQGQIQVPREQSSGASGQILMVLGPTILFVTDVIFRTLNMIYTTLLGLTNACYTSVCAPILGICGGVCGSCAILLATVLNAAYTTVCAPIMALLAACGNLIYTSVCAPLCGILGGLGGSVVGILAACVAGCVDFCVGVLNALYTTFCAPAMASVAFVLNACYTTICAIPIGLFGGVCGSCASLLAFVLNACYTSCVGIVDTLWNLVNSLYGFFCGLGCVDAFWSIFNSCWSLVNSACGIIWSLVDLVCASCVGGLNVLYTSICAPAMASVAFVLNACYTTICAIPIGLFGGVCGSLLGMGSATVVLIIAWITDLLDTCAALIITIAGSCDLGNLPVVQVLSFVTSLCTMGLSCFFALCSMSGIPCCGWCFTGPGGFALTTIGGICVYVILEGAYIINRVCSMLPVL